ncbi:MAG: T9SS type B sorting domain-containing protein, partial [Bacteroidetes bacterium]|nr:T9SS type B sorting domain-containing protein [Bacteroidota bacterium]
AGNTITISGTPSASGTFNYIIPLTGGCGTVDATGTITVTADNTASGASSTPTLCINTALTAITHTTTGATGIGAATGLPAGVSALWAGNTITISGTPVAEGTFNYSIPLTGGCGTVSATGTIVVVTQPNVTLSESGSPIAENGGVSTITATSSAVSGLDVTIDLTYSGTATGGGTDYTASGAIITIPAGSTTGTVTITGVDDVMNEGNETVVVDITSVTNGTEDGIQQQTITITDDDMPPVITSCAGDRTINADASCQATIPDLTSEVVATDNGTIVSITQSPTEGTVVSLGVHTVTITVTDDDANETTCTADVSVLDNIDPIATCQDITVSLDASGNVSIDSSDVDGGSSDNCSIATMSLDISSFTCLDLGTNTVTMTVTDGSGNVSICTVIVTVIDDLDPQVTCPGDTTVTASPADCSVAVDDISPVSPVDNCNANQVTFRLEGATSGTGFDDAGGTIFNKGITTVWYKIIDAGGNGDSCSFTVSVLTTLTPPDSAYSDRESVCPGDGIITLSYGGGDPTSGGTAVWYSDASFTTIVGSGNDLTIAAPVTSSTYFVRFESDCDTTSAESVTITVHPIPEPIFAEMAEEVCINGPLYLYVAGGEPGSSFAWSITNGTIVEDLNESIYVEWGSVVGTGNLDLTEVTAAGCFSLPVRLPVTIIGPIPDLGGDVVICDGESVTLSPGAAFASYRWHDGSSGPDFTSDLEGQIVIEVTDSYGCSAGDSMVISLADLPEVDLGADTTVCSDVGIILDAGDDGEQYLWSTGDVSRRIVVYNEGDQEIWVEVQNVLGCSLGDTVLIRACDLSHLLDMPTGFTPNGDGENEVWNIRSLDEFDHVIVEVYDQWGTLVWKSEPGYPTPWDGQDMRGNLVSFDSYHYVISFNDGSDERAVGYVTVMH